MYKLSPSDFAYLFEECKLCYCLKVKHNIYQPAMPMPGVFSAINTRLQGNLVGKNLKEISSRLPDGKVVNQEGWVESIVVPNSEVYIKGKYDLLVENSDNTHALVDLKISSVGEDKIDKYKTQLSAYKFALENPKEGNGIKITRLGLLIFYPDSVKFEGGNVYLSFPPTWLEVPIDEKSFISFISQVDKLLKGKLPSENMKCKWCQYRHLGDQLAHNLGEAEDIKF